MQDQRMAAMQVNREPQQSGLLDHRPLIALTSQKCKKHDFIMHTHCDNIIRPAVKIDCEAEFIRLSLANMHLQIFGILNSNML